MRSLSSNRFIAMLLCIALMFRVIVPAGFMPDMAAMQHGMYKIRICTGYGPQNMNMSVDQGQKQTDSGKTDTDHKSEKHSLCPFAGMQGSALLVLGIILALILLWRQVRFVPESAFRLSPSLASAWPRGPPLHLA
jgi:hypothetical protein